MKLEKCSIDHLEQEQSRAGAENTPSKRFKQEQSSTGRLQPENFSSNQIEPDGRSTNISVVQPSGSNLSHPEPQTRIKLYERIKRWNPMLQIQGPVRIPIRVSIMSALLVFPFIIVKAVINGLHLDFEHRTYASWIALAIANTLRCPLTVILAFKSTTKSSVQKKDDHHNGFPIKKDQNVSSDSETI